MLPKICLVMIVKNESHVIHDTLTHLLPYIDYCVISDTGSTDNTKEIIYDFCQQNQLPLSLQEDEWKDFGFNRSLVFDHAAKANHGCQYYMMFDADDKIKGKLPLFKKMSADAYYCIYGDDVKYNRLTLFKTNLEWGYKGVLHEYPYCKTKETIDSSTLEGEYYIDSRRIGARNNDPLKYMKDARVLMDALKTETDPTLISRYIFYAARSYKDAHMNQEAMFLYKKFLEDETRWFEERYYSWMEIARCMQSYNDLYSDLQIQSAYLAAAAEDPKRAEPYYELSKMYSCKQKHKLAYLFAKMGSKLPYPEDRILFSDQTIYNYKLDDQLAVTAFWTNRKDECKVLCEKILRRKDIPEDDRQRILKNLEFCKSI